MNASTPIGQPEQTKAASPRWWPAAFWGIFALALAVRTAWALAVPIDPVSDSQAYDLFARNMAEGHGYAFQPGQLTAYWPVGTPALYAAVYSIFGTQYGPAAALNVLIGAAVVALTMALARDWFGPRVGLATGLISCLWPGQVTFVSVLASEIPFNLCWLASLYLSTRPKLHPAARAVLAGAALAGASYIRPVALLLPAVFAWIRLIGPEGPRLWSRQSALIIAESVGSLLVMLVLILPWTLRNDRVFGHPVLISANGGVNLWMGNNPDSSGGYTKLPDEVEAMNEADRDTLLKAEAMQYIRQDPLAFVLRTLVKLVRTHDRETIGVVWNQPGLERTFGRSVLTPLKLISTVYWFLALGFAFIGAAVSLNQQKNWRWLGNPAIVLWAYFAALHAVIVSGDRYHYPSVPLIAILAGLGATSMLNLASRRRQGQV